MRLYDSSSHFQRALCIITIQRFGLQVKAQSPIVKLLSNDSDSSRDSLEQQQLSVQQTSELKAEGQTYISHYT